MERMAEVTKDWALRAAVCDACYIPKVGEQLSEFSQDDLLWFERLLTQEEKESLGRPLWTFAKKGSGDAFDDGYANGCGSVDGDEYGYGYGYGNWYADGSGEGYGEGYGYFYKDGSGRGFDEAFDDHGNGDGYAAGYGIGNDDGSGIGFRYYGEWKKILEFMKRE